MFIPILGERINFDKNSFQVGVFKLWSFCGGLETWWMIILHAQELGLVLLTTELVGHIVWSKRPLLPKLMMGRGWLLRRHMARERTRRREEEQPRSRSSPESWVSSGKAAKRAAAAAASAGKEAAEQRASDPLAGRLEIGRDDVSGLWRP